jgi:hypothetical protein
LTSFFNKDNVNVDGATESTLNNSAPIPNEVSQPNQSANAETTEKSKQNDNAQKRVFRTVTEWRERNFWIRYNGNKMTCTVCITENKGKSFTSGCTNFKVL